MLTDGMKQIVSESVHVLTVKKGARVPWWISMWRSELVDQSGRATTEVSISVPCTPWGEMLFALASFGGWLAHSPPAPAPVPAPAQVVQFIKPVAVRRRGTYRGTYAEYLATPDFRRIASAARKEWGYHCLMNVNHRGPVEMHHRNYQGVPFNEEWQDLIPLCEECHALYHGRLPKPDRGLFDELEQIKRAA